MVNSLVIGIGITSFIAGAILKNKNLIGAGIIILIVGAFLGI